MQRCSECNKSLYKETKYAKWLTLMNFFYFLEAENYVETSTASEMRDCLMTFKPFIDDDILDDLEAEKRQREKELTL